MKKIEDVLTTKNKQNYEMIIAVVGLGFSDYIISAARDAGATGATILEGRGTSDADKQVLGMLMSTERDVVMILIKKEERQKIMQAIADKTSLMEEGRGICFALPVSDVYGIKRVTEQKKEQVKKAKLLAKSKKSSNNVKVKKQ